MGGNHSPPKQKNEPHLLHKKAPFLTGKEPLSAKSHFLQRATFYKEPLSGQLFYREVCNASVAENLWVKIPHCTRAGPAPVTINVRSMTMETQITMQQAFYFIFC